MKLPRLETTSNAALSDRMSSVFENGYGDEGPVAKGCCLLLAIGVVLVILSPVIAIGIWIAL
jgi:hypothetical protein